ncbi:substrate-binding periplasmic protein, partial [candidate division CSSED10-310 bacterium]
MRYLQITIFLTLFSAVLLFSMKGISDEKIVSLAACEFPPYYGQNLTNQGVVTEITAEAFKKVDYTLKVKFYPWARALDYGKKGLVDGILGLWYTTEREQWFGFSMPLHPNHLGFYKRKSDLISFKSLHDLKPYKIGIVLGYANPPGFNQAHLKTEAVITDKNNLMKLYRKRIDLALIDKDVAQYIMKT